MENQSQEDKTQEIANKRIIGKPFKNGNPGGPGRPKDTENDIIVKKAVKEWLKDHEQGLAEALPEIRPALISKAKQGNINAIREIHEVVGAHKNKEDTKPQNVNINVEELRVIIQQNLATFRADNQRTRVLPQSS